MGNMDEKNKDNDHEKSLRGKTFSDLIAQFKFTWTSLDASKKHYFFYGTCTSILFVIAFIFFFFCEKMPFNSFRIYFFQKIDVS